MSDEAASYYASRTDVYDDSGRDAESLRTPIKARYRELFKGRDVLEVACGSGYWTCVLAEAARSVLAVDINQNILHEASERCCDLPNVAFRIADAFTFLGVPTGFDAAVAIWWYSHVPRANVPQFLKALRSVLSPGALVVFIDQLPAERAALAADAGGNTLEERTLPDGRRFSVIKNFLTETELRAAITPFGDDFAYAAHPDGGWWEVNWRVKG